MTAGPFAGSASSSTRRQARLDRGSIGRATTPSVPLLKPEETAAGFPLSGREVRLTAPITDEQIRALHVGDVVLISGQMFTGRDAVHAYLTKHDAPVDLRGGVLYHCGPVVVKDAQLPRRRRTMDGGYRRGPDDEHPGGAVSGRHHQPFWRAHRDRKRGNGRQDTGGPQGERRGVSQCHWRRRAVLCAHDRRSPVCRCWSSARRKRCGISRSGISRQSSRWTRTATACTRTSKTQSGVHLEAAAGG